LQFVSFLKFVLKKRPIVAAFFLRGDQPPAPSRQHLNQLGGLDMTRLSGFICALFLCGVLAAAQATGNNGGGQTSSPGSGQPGTGNVPGTGAGQGTGGDITTTPKTTSKKKKATSHKSGKKGKKSTNSADTGSNSSTPK
jgi:hypothetical protein